MTNPHFSCSAGSESAIRSVLREHWITSVNCDKSTGTNYATCSCSAWRGRTWTSVQAAVDEWIDHVFASAPHNPIAEAPGATDALIAVWDDWTTANDESGMENYEIKDVAPETVGLVERVLRGVPK